MNILLSVNNLGLGGVTSYVVHLATGLSQKNKVIIFDQYPYASDYESVSGLPREILIESVWKNKLKDLVNWKINALLCRFQFNTHYWESTRSRYLKKIIQKHDIDIIVSFDKFSDKIIAHTIGDSIPLVISMHGSYDLTDALLADQNQMKEMENVLQKARAIIYKSDKNIQILKKGIVLDNIQIIKKILHGYHPDKPAFSRSKMRRKLKIKPDAFVFGMIARPIAEKGWREAIAAFLQVRDEIQRDLHFVAIGGGDYLDELKKEFSSTDCIHFTGVVFPQNTLKTEEPCVMDWLNILDVGLLPTYFPTENYSYSVIEYLHCKIPTIASDHGEISVTLDAGGGTRAGILVTHINGRPDIAGFREAMKLYLLNPVIYDMHRKLTPKALKKFDPEKAVREYEKVFEQVLQKKHNS